jgi:predicted nuclease of predicted toxin-antitoxin system
MKFLADENIIQPVVDALREQGYVVGYITELSPGIDDDVILEKAFDKDYVLLTEDKDFGELVYRIKHRFRSVVLIRLHGLSAQSKVRILTTAIKEHGTEFSGNFIVISYNTIRIRRRSS